MLREVIIQAIQNACNRAGGQVILAAKSGVSQGQISDYIRGRRQIKNMTVGTLEKLFPELVIYFFHDELPLPEPRTAQSIYQDIGHGDSEEPMREELLEIFDSLGPRDRARCLALLAAHFGDKLREEPQPVKKVAGGQVS